MQDLHDALHWRIIIQHNTVQYSKHNTQYTHNKHIIKKTKSTTPQKTMQAYSQS